MISTPNTLLSRKVHANNDNDIDMPIYLMDLSREDPVLFPRLSCLLSLRFIILDVRRQFRVCISDQRTQPLVLLAFR